MIRYYTFISLICNLFLSCCAKSKIYSFLVFNPLHLFDNLFNFVTFVNVGAKRRIRMYLHLWNLKNFQILKMLRYVFLRYATFFSIIINLIDLNKMYLSGMQLNKYILSAKERRFKTALWKLINRDYLEVIIFMISSPLLILPFVQLC